MDTVIGQIAPLKFSIETYDSYRDIPLEVLDTLPYSVYIIDYNWIYIFLNKNSISVFGADIEQLIGQSALDAFKHSRFEPVFDKIKNGVEHRTACHEIIYSPLRGAQVTIKGYPLSDCYFFSSSIMPAKEEVLEELRVVLKRRSEE
jgi:hypothetical protein